jgi:hypothetical protein
MESLRAVAFEAQCIHFVAASIWSRRRINSKSLPQDLQWYS